MESSPNQFTQPFGRLKRAAHAVFDHITAAPERHSNHYRPSTQRDVGKTAAQAAAVQLVIEGLQEYQPSPIVVEDRSTGFDADGNYHVAY